MAEQNPDVIKQEIDLLEQQLAAKRAELGQDVDAPYERAEVLEVLGERTGPEGAAPATTPIPSVSAGSSSDLPSWQDPALASQVQQLVDVAFTQSVQAALDQARRANNPALVDALHDILADELHEQLVARQKLAPAI